MKQLVLMYWGTIFLMYLSQRFYSVKEIQDSHLRTNNFMWRKADVFMALTIAWLCCFSFLRQHYNDTWTYRIHFDEAESVAEFITSGGLWRWTKNPLSVLYRNFIRGITDDYHIYFFFPALLNSFAIVKLCKQYSPNPAFSILIFFSLGTYVMYMAALKQCIAVLFVLLAIPYAVEKKYGRFYLFVFIAILFHTHAFMFAIIPLLCEKPWGKNIWFLLLVVLIAMVTYNDTFGAFMEYAQSIGALVDEGELFDGHSVNIVRVLVYWIPALLALIFRRRLFYNSTRMENVFVNMSIVSAFILTIGLVQAANLFARMSGYFEVATIIALPWMINKLFTEKSARIVICTASVLYFMYFLYENVINRDFANDYVAITLWEYILSWFV